MIKFESCGELIGVKSVVMLSCVIWYLFMVFFLKILIVECIGVFDEVEKFIDDFVKVLDILNLMIM